MSIQKIRNSMHSGAEKRLEKIFLTTVFFISLTCVGTIIYFTAHFIIKYW